MVCSIGLATSCDQEEVSVPNVPRENSTAAEIVEQSISVVRGNDPTFTIRQNELVEPFIDEAEAYWYKGEATSGQLGIRVIGGTAVEGEDYEFIIDLIEDFSPFLLQEGYYYEYDAGTSLENTVSGIINVFDDGVSGGTKTIELQFFPVGIASILIDDTMTITITD